MRLFIAVAALLLLSLTGPVPASAVTPSLPSVHNGRPTPGGDRPAPGGDRPAPGGDRLAPGGDRSAPGGDRPAPGGDQPAPGGVQQRTHGDTLTSQHHNSHASVHNSSQQNYKDFPCPDEQDIAPCNCSVDDESRLSLDCSAVVSDEQLASVFTAYFPVTDYYKFVIDQNDNIGQLGYILNGVTFQFVSLTKVFNLKTISEEFLLDSLDTLETLNIDYSALTRDMFPFLTLPLYSQLQYLTIRHSLLTSIPHLTSNSLTRLDFYGCAITNSDTGTFDAVPQMKELHLSNNALTSLQPGAFTLTNSLKYLYLRTNQLTTIEPGTFVVPENSEPTSSSLLISLYANSLSNLVSNTFIMTDRPHEIYLYRNSLSSLAAGAFVLPQTTEQFSLLLSLYDNNLTFLEEQVLGELFPYITTLYVNGNPLACGCDVAWLVLNPEYMSKIDAEATCADGRVFQELDPAYYETFC